MIDKQCDNFKRVDGDLYRQFFTAIEKAKKTEKLKTLAGNFTPNELRDLADSIESEEENSIQLEIDALIEWTRDVFVQAMDKAGYGEFELAVKDGELGYILIKDDE